MQEIPTSLRVAGRDYQIVQRLGRGTFGEVYRTRDDQGREFALKLLAAEPAPSRLSSFKNEFLLLTQIKHPYLCAAHGFDYSPALQRYLFVFDYAPGQSFFEATSQKSFEEIERLALMILEVLDHLHLHEVVHFDIKCPNIIVTPEGSIKLLDLGLARRETVPLEKFPGSLLYAAPEILVRSRSADHRADLYSLGIVLYRALTRHFPFDENDPSQIIEWHLRKGLAWAPEESEKIPHYLRQLIEFLLRKSPAERLSQARAAINWVHLHTGHRYRPSGGRRPDALPSEGSLIAREKELALARDTLAASSGKTLFLLGERGIGKSRLLREIRYMAEVQEFHCLWFDRSTEGNALSQLARQLEVPLSQAPDEFFRLSLKALAKRAPVALFVDDLQEVEPLLWEWISRVWRQRLAAALFLGWEGGTPPTGPLVPLFQKEAVVPLSPLTRDDLKAYLTPILGDPEASERWVEPLFEFSSGLPLLVTEGIRYLLDAAEGKKLPESIEKLYEETLLPLSSEALDLLKTLALWRQPATLEELSSSLLLEVSEIAPLLPPLISQGLVTRLSSFEDPQIRYRLGNAALTATLLKRQKGEERRRRTRRILKLLESRENPSLEELVPYALEAGDRKRGREYLSRLAEVYEKSFQTQRAIETYKTLLRIAPNEPPNEPPDEPNDEPRLAATALRRLIPLLVLAGRPDEALSLFPKTPLSLPERKLKGWVLTRSGRFQEAAALYQEGIRESSEDDPLHRELLNDLANVYVQTDEPRKAIPLFQKTLPPEGVSDDERFASLKNNNLGLALAIVGEIDEARRFETARLDLFRRAKDEHQVAASLSQLGFVEHKGQNFPQALSHFEEALALSEKLGDLHNILILLDHLIGLSQRRAEYDRALRYFSKATDYRSLVSPPYQIAQNELKGAFLYLAIGLPEPARFCLERIEPLGPQAVSTTLKGWIALAWGYYHRARGESEKAALKFQESLAVASPKTDPSLSSWGYYALADLRREEKRFEEAVRIYRQASQTPPLKGNEELRLRTRLLGLLLQKEGKLNAEVVEVQKSDRKLVGGPAALGRLARQCEEEGMPEIAAEAYRALGDPRADEIYEEIASHLPEEYRLAYRSDRKITRER